MSFGFAEFDIQLHEKYIDIDCELACSMIAQQRSIIAAAHLPTISKFIDLLAVFSLVDLMLK
jgi:hypothetical protein